MDVAGDIYFSPAEIAAIIAVLTVMALVVTSPGWLLLAFVMGRRSGGSRSRRWGARIAGALLGIVVSAAVGAGCLSVTGPSSDGILLGAVASWAVNGALAWVLWPRRAAASYDG